MLVGGDLTVRRNVRIEGWLDAPNLRTPAKGLFPTVASLEQQCRWPRPGEWALVGNSLPAPLYVARNGRWEYSGHEAGSLTLDTSPLSTLIEDAAHQAAEAAEAAAEARTEAAEARRISTMMADYSQRVEQAETSADDAWDRATATGVIPFDGILPSRSAVRPKQGVWFERGDDIRPGRFLVISCEDGFTESDYNDLDSDTDGYTPARTDRLFRCRNRLYTVADGQLLPLSPEPFEGSDEEDVHAAMLDTDELSGRFYCVVDPATRRVTSLFYL